MDIKPTDTLPRSVIRRTMTKKSAAPSSPFSSLPQQSIDQSELNAPSNFPSITLDYLAELSSHPHDAHAKAITYGQQMIHELENLKDTLLQGGVTKTQLMQLRHLTQQNALHGLDDRLISIIEEIRIRAEVELAKLDAQS